MSTSSALAGTKATLRYCETIGISMPPPPAPSSTKATLLLFRRCLSSKCYYNYVRASLLLVQCVGQGDHDIYIRVLHLLQYR